MTNRTPHACAVQNTVVGTVASASYAVGMQSLARSAREVGFLCIVVMPFDWFDDLRHDLIVALPIVSPPLRPRTLWCNGPLQNQYGWRRSQLYRARLWRVILHMRLDLLALDLDHQIGRFNPVPVLRTTFAPAESPAFHMHSGPEASLRPGHADVIAVWDGPAGKYLNVGIMWVRSTESTRTLSLRSENRSFAGWEQEIFNEEVNYNEEFSGVRCCHSMCFKRLFTASKVVKALPGKTSKGGAARTRAEGIDRCTDNQPLAAYPPRGSSEAWVGKWQPSGETLRSKHSSNRKYGRCNHGGNVCIALNSSGQTIHYWDDPDCNITYAAGFLLGVKPSGSIARHK